MSKTKNREEDSPQTSKKAHNEKSSAGDKIKNWFKSLGKPKKPGKTGREADVAAIETSEKKKNDSISLKGDTHAVPVGAPSESDSERPHGNDVKEPEHRHHHRSHHRKHHKPAKEDKKREKVTKTRDNHGHKETEKEKEKEKKDEPETTDEDKDESEEDESEEEAHVKEAADEEAEAEAQAEAEEQELA